MVLSPSSPSPSPHLQGAPPTPCAPVSGPMEGDGVVRSWKDLSFAELERILPVVHLHPYIRELPPPPPPAKSEEEEAWEAILGTPLYNWMNAEVTESNRAILEYLMDNEAKLRRYNLDCYKKTEEVNAKLDGKDKLAHIDVLPRSPTPSCFYYWYKMYRMNNTSTTSLKNMRFTEPGKYEYSAGALLQLFSISFAGSFLHGESMSVYGFLAIRDDIDLLRNYVFCRSREDAHVIKQDSPDLPLISPVRGISSLGPPLVEYSIKVKNNDDHNSCGDCEIIDGCFQFIPWNPYHNDKVKPRIYGPLGPVDMQLMYISNGVEATIDVKVKWAAKGYSLKAVTAYTSGHPSGILLYDRPASSLVSNNSASAWVAVASSVVAVDLDGELKLAVDVCVEYNPRHEHNREVKVKQAVQTHELSFTAQKYKSTKGAILMGRNFKLVAKVTWSNVDN